MARFLYWTDLHTEFAPFIPPAPDAVGPIDAVLLGGDTAVGMMLAVQLETIARTYQVPVLFVLGNHEYYGQEVHAFHRELHHRLDELRRDGLDIRWLNGDAHTIAGTRVVGATLWTDMAIHGPNTISKARRIAEGSMNDYRRITITETGPADLDIVGWTKPRALTTADTMRWHDGEKTAILSHLDTPFNGPTLVLTHHLPSPWCIAGRYRGDGLNAAFASDLDADIASRQVDWWLYGHSHGPVTFDLPRTDGGVCQMRSNCRGYPKEWVFTGFNPLGVIDTNTVPPKAPSAPR